MMKTCGAYLSVSVFFKKYLEIKKESLTGEYFGGSTGVLSQSRMSSQYKALGVFASASKTKIWDPGCVDKYNYETRKTLMKLY